MVNKNDKPSNNANNYNSTKPSYNSNNNQYDFSQKPLAATDSKKNIHNTISPTNNNNYDYSNNNNKTYSLS